ncbi:MAG: 2-oxo acid dehydrogenase subunit E2 [Verrucomicrobia bacterium]|nr:2-oxo acid dehydrogenase subunit E2 [Verrucomicrobiota bacterium]
MALEMKLPELGENVEKGYVVKVLVSAGDTVAIDQPVIELETDKATVEVPASVAGVVKEILVHEQDEISVGQVILTVEEGGQAKQTASAPKEAAAPKPENAAPKQATPVEEKPTATAQPAPPPPKPVRAPESEHPKTPQAAVPAAPSVRTLAREIGVDVSQVRPAGADGRITVDDVKAHARALLESGATTPGGVPSPPPLPDFARWGPIERQPMSNIRRRTTEHLALAWSQVPHVTQFDLADVTEIEQSRKRFAAEVEQHGGKLTITAILAKVAASALSAFPQFRASLDVASDEIVLKKYCHIGIAVDTERGLLVPVLRDVDQKSIIEIAAELTELAGRTRQGKAHLDELQGGVFTITNLGGIGGTHFSPIVNYPEVAILGVGRARDELRLLDGEVVARLILPLALSYDHRVIDGGDGARFLHWIVEALEQPLKLSIEG